MYNVLSREYWVKTTFRKLVFFALSLQYINFPINHPKFLIPGHKSWRALASTCSVEHASDTETDLPFWYMVHYVRHDIMP